MKSKFIIMFFCLCAGLVKGQITSTPYSVFGLGEIQSKSMAHHMSMGTIGIAAPTFHHINSVNPALLTYNRFSSFEIGLQGENRSKQNTENDQSTTSVGFKYLSFAFPVVANRFTTNIGMRPYSTVNYNFVTESPIDNSDSLATVTRNGEGGITEYYWSNGVRIFDNLSLGVRASFLFGQIQENQRVDLSADDITFSLSTGTSEVTTYKGINYGFGASYHIKLSDKKRIYIGATYDLKYSLEGERVVEQVYFNNLNLPQDTLTDLSFSGTFEIPMELGIGITYEYMNRFMVSLDLKRSIWDSKASFSELSPQRYRNTYQGGLGLEFIPKFNDVNSYLNRVRYRLGISYEQLPYLAGGNEIDDFGINFGCSLPVRSFSSVNLAFKYGQRGSDRDELVRENYFKFIFGATLNDRWFIRRKYN